MKPEQLSYENQLLKLAEYGIICNSKEKEKNAEMIKSIGYYALKQFAMPFNTSTDSEKLNFNNLTFEQLLKRYYQDKNFRIALLHAIQCIEISIKNNFSFILGEDLGGYGYLDFSLWSNMTNNPVKSEREELKFKLRLLANIKKSDIYDLKIKSNLDHQLPTIWLMTNVLTLGEIEYLVKMLNLKFLEKLSACYDLTPTEFKSWLKCLVLVRNICCHNSDLLDFKMKTKPKVPKKYKNYLYRIKKDRLTDNKDIYTDKIALVVFIIRDMMEHINPKYNFFEIDRCLKNITLKEDTLAYKLGFRSYKGMIDGLLEIRQVADKKA